MGLSREIGLQRMNGRASSALAHLATIVHKSASLSPNWAEKVTALAESLAAVGLIGALAVATLVWKTDRRERARAEVRRVRAWIELSDDLEAWGTTKESEESNIRVVIENASDEVIYDVRSRLVAPILVRDAGFYFSQGRLAPGSIMSSVFGLTIEKRKWWLQESSGHTGVDVLFTDGRGVRWWRDDRGTLNHVKPMRAWAPWRVPPAVQFEFEELPRWSPAAHWHYRREFTEARAREGWPIPWYAFDLMWRRRKITKSECPLPGHFWNLILRWKTRKAITNSRLRSHLAVPIWAIDLRYQYWTWYRRELKTARAEDRKLKEQTATFD